MKQPRLQYFLHPYFLRPYFLDREEGSSLVEFALVLPIFLTLLLGMVDLGNGFNTYIGMLNATREGVNWLRIHPDDIAGMNARIEGELERVGLTTEAIFITRTPEKSTYEDEDIVTLTLEYPYELMFGALTSLPILTLHTENTMRVGN